MTDIEKININNTNTQVSRKPGEVQASVGWDSDASARSENRYSRAEPSGAVL
jgi:hypothetical protein